MTVRRRYKLRRHLITDASTEATAGQWEPAHVVNILALQLFLAAAITGRISAAASAKPRPFQRRSATLQGDDEARLCGVSAGVGGREADGCPAEREVATGPRSTRHRHTAVCVVTGRDGEADPAALRVPRRSDDLVARAAERRRREVEVRAPEARPGSRSSTFVRRGGRGQVPPKVSCGLGRASEDGAHGRRVPACAALRGRHMVLV
jgi:hypothetical protein